MNTIQAFRILNLSPTASQQQVKQSFKQLAKQFRPDVNANDTTAKFQEINNAYEIDYAFAIKNNAVSRPQPPAKISVKQYDTTSIFEISV